MLVGKAVHLSRDKVGCRARHLRTKRGASSLLAIRIAVRVGLSLTAPSVGVTAHMLAVQSSNLGAVRAGPVGNVVEHFALHLRASGEPVRVEHGRQALIRSALCINAIVIPGLDDQSDSVTDNDLGHITGHLVEN